MVPRSDSLRLLAACWTIALAIGLTACGGDDDADSDAGDNAAAAPTTAAETAEKGTDEQQIKALVARVQKAFNTGDGQVLCDGLTDRGQRDVVDYGHATGLSGQCTKVATSILKREITAGTEQRPVDVVSVRVRGSSAIALIRIPGATSLQQRYRKQDGQWKIGSLNLVAAAGTGTGSQ